MWCQHEFSQLGSRKRKAFVFLSVRENHQLEEALLQSLVFRRALVEEVIGEDHVGHPQTEEHHQRPSGVGWHGQADQVGAVRHSDGEAGAAFLRDVDVAVTVIEQIGALVADGGIIRAVVRGGNLQEE